MEASNRRLIRERYKISMLTVSEETKAWIEKVKYKEKNDR